MAALLQFTNRAISFDLIVARCFHHCECRRRDSRSAASPLNVSAHQGQALSGVFLKRAHWSGAIQFVSHGGREWEGRKKEKEFWLEIGILASFSFKQIHFVHLKGNLMIYTAGLTTEPTHNKGITFQSLGKFEHTHLGGLLRCNSEKNMHLLFNKGAHLHLKVSLSAAHNML